METVVRRLTPTECERLQGYPDGWTDIGEWTDTKGKLHKESSDSARYKALGNSIALPFWFYLLRRISAQYERPATLGSLFDGIGGFPLIWETLNGKGTCLWASEIEEFPIAVTKKHFPEMDETADHNDVKTYGFEPGVAKRLNPESRFTEETSPTIRAKAGDNQTSVAIIEGGE